MLSSLLNCHSLGLRSLDKVICSVGSVGCALSPFFLRLPVCLCLFALPDVLGHQKDRDPRSVPALEAATPAARYRQPAAADYARRECDI